ncbi:unnamed protein product [Pleuronectes platessa]|uniref:Uncharacterized protein n=1 Tax=Pleuronectes platessa TaxID=8262 RepID=A0A9N7VBX7_PLEPL|nr:unnamed protein product [Pleuronectes platessa]
MWQPRIITGEEKKNEEHHEKRRRDGNRQRGCKKEKDGMPQIAVLCNLALISADNPTEGRSSEAGRGVKGCSEWLAGHLTVGYLRDNNVWRQAGVIQDCSSPIRLRVTALTDSSFNTAPCCCAPPRRYPHLHPNLSPSPPLPPSQLPVLGGQAAHTAARRCGEAPTVRPDHKAFDNR